MDSVVNIDKDKIEEYLNNIILYDRLSGTKGEMEALKYIENELKKERIKCKTHFYTAILSNPISSQVYYKYNGDKFLIKSKTRSFSASTGSEEIKGELIYIPENEFVKSIIEYELKKNSFGLDLVGKIVISESLSPVAILQIQKRGAIGYIQYWEGEEDLIHEGIFNPIWGMPLYNELGYYPQIPIVAISGKDGKSLIEKLNKLSIIVSISTLLEKRLAQIPVLEAIIEPSKKTEEFLLIGNHIDSWHFGATDNGTGNALALYLAKGLNEKKDRLKIGVKIAWWSGHSNGRYVGSSIYARENFLELMNGCLAYMNIDMPGLRGANNYRRISSGPELFELAYKNIKKMTGQEGHYVGPIRGWDQSFQNIGVTPYFIWSSTLDDNHKDSTGKSFMSWWWHTEKDNLEYYDKEILELDAKLYLVSALDILEKGINVFNIDNLFKEILDELYLLKKDNDIFDISNIIDLLIKVKSLYNHLDEGLSSNIKIILVKKLNQIYYTHKESYFQDFALQGLPMPGLNELIRIYKLLDDSEEKEILIHQTKCELNRIKNILMEIELFLKTSKR